MKKLLFIALSLLLFSCNDHGAGKLRGFVEEGLQKDKGILKLSKYNEVKWDKVYVLGPYSSKKMLDKTLAKHYQDIMLAGIFNHDDICLVLLFNGDQLVSQATFDIIRTDLSATSVFTPNDRYAPCPKDSANYPYVKKNRTYILRRF
ncbi:hypothetical protein MUY27_08240 [Mucilaginibacter sp. RS28]|uniref:Lipoprotein n=1 Tax=Mucilaginibacter straminoryzae TaxID=2932774 RepID=A0A9X1X3X4_9SPHI|nr:hypothetical protein [Mucilaginibacter straminoryzae]MCJ8209695.1 hypothetical protein [Mucilaginibacter straminoryzae]